MISNLPRGIAFFVSPYFMHKKADKDILGTGIWVHVVSFQFGTYVYFCTYSQLISTGIPVPCLWSLDSKRCLFTLPGQSCENGVDVSGIVFGKGWTSIITRADTDQSSLAWSSTAWCVFQFPSHGSLIQGQSEPTGQPLKTVCVMGNGSIWIKNQKLGLPNQYSLYDYTVVKVDGATPER